MREPSTMIDADWIKTILAMQGYEIDDVQARHLVPALSAILADLNKFDLIADQLNEIPRNASII